MGHFRYRALDARGRSRRGLIDADGPRQARQQIIERGLIPLQLDPAPAAANTGQWLQRGLPTRQLATATRQLALLLRAGLPLDRALSTIVEQAGGSRLAGVLGQLRTRVREGLPLADACAEQAQVFPDFYRAMVRAGEDAGHLDQVLERLAEHLEQRDALRQRLQLALLYPAILSTVSLLIVIALLTWVVPQITAVFDSLDQQLPALTRWLVSLSNWMARRGGLLLAGLSLLWLAGRLLLRRPQPRLIWDRLLLRLPLVGRMTRDSNAARVVRTLAILVDSGVELLGALRIAAATSRNQVMTGAIRQAALQLREGVSLQRALAAQGYLPPLTLQLIASGESSGQLGSALRSAADQLEQDLARRSQWLVGLFEPALILFMGGIVLGIVIAILLPIIEMNQLLG